MEIIFDRSKLEKSLRGLFDGTIYHRGMEYYRDDAVLWFDANIPKEDNRKGEIESEAEVRGTEDYYVTVLFDTRSLSFIGGECDCPYEDYCKHMAAVGLKFIERFDVFLENPIQFANARDVADQFVSWIKNGGRRMEKQERTRDMIRDAVVVPQTAQTEKEKPSVEVILQNLGIDPAILSASVLEELRAKMAPTKARDVPVPPPVPLFHVEEKQPVPVPFGERYYVVVETKYGGLHPEIIGSESAKAGQYYWPNDRSGNVARILKKEKQNVTEAQEKLLVFLRDQDSWSGKYDCGELFCLLKDSGIPVYLEKKSPQAEIKFDENPQRLQVEIFTRIESRRHPFHYDKKLEETAFVFRLAKKYFGREKLFVGKKHAAVIRVQERAVALLAIPEIVQPILFRAAKNERGEQRWNGDDYGGTSAGETMLKDLEAIRVNDIVREAGECCELLAAVPEYEMREYKNPKPCIVVDYDGKANTLEVRATMDYGLPDFEKRDVSETVSASYRGGKIVFAPIAPWPYETHIVRVSDSALSFASISKQKEVALFKKFYENPEYGFNKHLECRREGEKKIAKFILEAWPEILATGYEIEFVKDILRVTEERFKADFTVEMDAGIDWLAFDVLCYSGEGKILPEDLQDYIENGRDLLKMADGTFRKITNREDLERFVAMLESFNARENGRFEGRTYSAPELENIFTSSEHYNAKVSEGFKRFMEEATSGKPVKKVRIPAVAEKILRDYQKDGVHWFHFLKKYRFAGILADDMGLGKTLQALTLIHMSKSVGIPSLVACPKTLLSVWEDEAAKFFPGMKTLVIEGPPSERAQKWERTRDAELVIASYPILQRDEEFLKEHKLSFHYLLLDEAQHIKNHKTKNAQTVKKIDADYRLALTGTPLENNISEIWSIFEFLMPGFLGRYASFSRSFLNPIMKENNARALSHLRKKVECFMLRRTKREVLKELPDKIEQVSECRMTDAQNVLYQEILARVKRDVFNSVAKKGFAKSHIHILAGLTKLRQVCNHPVLLLKDKNHRKYESAKLELFLELIENIAASGRKTLVFSQFTTMLDILSDELRERGIKHSYLSGKTQNRKTLVNNFNMDPDQRVFLISLKAGGTGLTLTSADNVIIFDPWWNPSAENQAIDRTHRIGQKNTVNVYKLITKGTIEEKILELQKRKKFLFDALVGESGNLFKKLTWEDIRGLF